MGNTRQLIPVYDWQLISVEYLPVFTPCISVCLYLCTPNITIFVCKIVITSVKTKSCQLMLHFQVVSHVSEQFLGISVIQLFSFIPKMYLLFLKLYFIQFHIYFS